MYIPFQHEQSLWNFAMIKDTSESDSKRKPNYQTIIRNRISPTESLNAQLLLFKLGGYFPKCEAAPGR